MSPYYNNWLFNVFPTCNLLPLFSASDDQKRCLFIMLSCFTWFTPNLICVFVLVKNNCVKNIHQHSVGSMSTVASIHVILMITVLQKNYYLYVVNSINSGGSYQIPMCSNNINNIKYIRKVYFLYFLLNPFRKLKCEKYEKNVLFKKDNRIF